MQRVDLRWKRGMRTADSSAAFAEDESFKEDQAEEQGPRSIQWQRGLHTYANKDPSPNPPPPLPGSSK